MCLAGERSEGRDAVGMGKEAPDVSQQPSKRVATDAGALAKQRSIQAGISTLDERYPGLRIIERSLRLAASSLARCSCSACSRSALATVTPKPRLHAAW